MPSLLLRFPAAVLASLLVVFPRPPAQQDVRATLTSISDRPAAPAFRLANASGRLIGLADFRGRPVVVNLWATTCGGCVKEIPAFVALDRSYKDKGVSIIGVSLDVMYEDLKSAREGWQHVTPFVREYGMKYPVVLDDGSVEKSFNVTALPATYLIDRRGSIAAAYIGVVDASDVEANLKKLLNEAR